MPAIEIRRVYDHAPPPAGREVLVDRVWPRGKSKADLKDALWLKDVAPSAALRKWFGHDPARWDEFRRRYAKEVHQHAELLDQLRSFAREGPITLVYSAHDEKHNDAVELRELILGK